MAKIRIIIEKKLVRFLRKSDRSALIKYFKEMKFYQAE